jgi:hypothetical protein
MVQRNLMIYKLAYYNYSCETKEINIQIDLEKLVMMMQTGQASSG